MLSGNPNTDYIIQAHDYSCTIIIYLQYAEHVCSEKIKTVSQEKNVHKITFHVNVFIYENVTSTIYRCLLPYSHLDLMKTSYSNFSESTTTVGYRMYDRVLSLSSKSCTRRVSFATAFLNRVFSSKSFISSDSLMESPGMKGNGCLELNSLQYTHKKHYSEWN